MLKVTVLPLVGTWVSFRHVLLERAGRRPRLTVDILETQRGHLSFCLSHHVVTCCLYKFPQTLGDYKLLQWMLCSKQIEKVSLSWLPAHFLLQSFVLKYLVWSQVPHEAPLRSGLGETLLCRKPENIRCTNSKFCNKKHGNCWMLICGGFMFLKLAPPFEYKNRDRLWSTLTPPQTPKGLSFKIYHSKRDRGDDLTRFWEK